MARVVLENLAKLFTSPDRSKLKAVDNANLTLEDKELLVLVGPSGCGKTTTLRLIAGLERPTTGTIAIDGQVVNEVAPKDRDVAMVFQNYALYPHMTVYENMAFGLKLRKVAKTEIDKRVQDAAEMLELTSCLERRPEVLSGGQRQRVALGRALVRRPKIMLLDEPLSGLDARLREQMRGELVRLQARLGLTMLYVTHDQDEAVALGNRIAVMNKGTIQQIADPMCLYQYPVNRFVAEFFGSPRMNFFEGEILQNGSLLLFRERPARKASHSTPGSLANSGNAASRRAHQSSQPVGDTAGAATVTGTNSHMPFSLKLAEASIASLRPYVGKEVVLGIRPEHIRISAMQGPGERPVEARAQKVDIFGPEKHLHLTSAAHSFIARVAHGEGGAAMQQDVPLDFQMAHAHFFDVATQKRIGT